MFTKKKDLLSKLEQGYYSEIYDLLEKEISVYSIDVLVKYLPKAKSILLYNYMIYAISRNETIDKYETIFDILIYLNQFVDDDYSLIRWHTFSAILKFSDSIDIQEWLLEYYYKHPTPPFSNDELIQFSKDILKIEPENKLAKEALSVLTKEKLSRVKYKCACCGNYTLEIEPPGTFEICPVCYWEDDNIQFDNPDYEGGANVISLNKARENYKKIGAISDDYLTYVREPSVYELKSDVYYCKLLNKNIDEGLCYDINFQNEKYAKEDVLTTIKKQLNKDNEQIKLICENCRNYPL